MNNPVILRNKPYINAWLDGQSVQCVISGSETDSWSEVRTLCAFENPNLDFRITPSKREELIKIELVDSRIKLTVNPMCPNIKLMFDANGSPVSAEVVADNIYD